MQYIIGNKRFMDELKAYIKTHQDNDVTIEVMVVEYYSDKENILQSTTKASAIEDLDEYIYKLVLNKYNDSTVKWYELVHAEVGDMWYHCQDMNPYK